MVRSPLLSGVDLGGVRLGVSVGATGNAGGSGSTIGKHISILKNLTEPKLAKLSHQLQQLGVSFAGVNVCRVFDSVGDNQLQPLRSQQSQQQQQQGQPGGQQQQQPLANVDPVPCFLIYDSLLETVKASSLILQESYTKFIEGASNVHHLFQQYPDLQQIWLKDHCGYLYCSKVFSKETYYPYFSLPAQEKLMDKIENDAKKLFIEQNRIFFS